jgi:hypothetical protein
MLVEEEGWDGREQRRRKEQGRKQRRRIRRYHQKNCPVVV